jgi:K+-transporting ATPase KdpF subunit
MNFIYLIGSLITVGIVAYLMVALLKPEWFS